MLARVVSRMAAPSSFVRPLAARGVVHSPWGSDAWRHDKNVYKQWCKDATVQDSMAQRQFYGFCAMAFGDVDANKDGLIDAKEFDLLCEKIAALPRRFGMAPGWEKEFGGDLSKRNAVRAAVFNDLDTRNGPARGVLGLKQVFRWATEQNAERVLTIDTKSKVDFAHVAEYDEATFLNYLEHALANPSSGAFTSFYEFLLTAYVEADVHSKGTINRSEFDVLVERAASVPRVLGLAPPVDPNAVESKVFRDKLFASMDDNQSGSITFRKFLQWTVSHTKMKIKHHRGAQ